MADTLSLKWISGFIETSVNDNQYIFYQCFSVKINIPFTVQYIFIYIYIYAIYIFLYASVGTLMFLNLLRDILGGLHNICLITNWEWAVLIII